MDRRANGKHSVMAADQAKTPTEGDVYAACQAFQRVRGTQFFRERFQPCLDQGDVGLDVGIMVVAEGMEVRVW